jgi:MOSC domain-containing protein YiiM
MISKTRTGKLLAIATKKSKGASMIPLESTLVTTEHGIEGDHRGKPGDRQVTVVSQDSWDEACRELNQSVPWIARRANLLVGGISFKDSTGYILHIGELILEITGETKPCDRMDEFIQGLQNVLIPDWRAGVTCRVIKSGEIKLGDRVTLSNSNEKR